MPVERTKRPRRNVSRAAETDQNTEMLTIMNQAESSIRAMSGLSKARRRKLRTILEIRARSNRLWAEEVDLIAEFARRAGSPGEAAQKLSRGLAIDEATAEYHLTVARALTAHFPRFLEAMRCGGADGGKPLPAGNRAHRARRRGS